MESDEPAGGPVEAKPLDAFGLSEHFAGHLKESALALFLNGSLAGALPQVDLTAYKLYRDRFLADCGNPTDPVEIVLVEQVVMAHLITGHLQVRGANAKSIESAAVYLGAAARLTGELRRTALALQAFRMAARQLNNDAGRESLSPGELVHDTDNEKGIAPRRTDEECPPTVPLRRSATR
jgi:hypothetical protein